MTNLKEHITEEEIKNSTILKFTDQPYMMAVKAIEDAVIRHTIGNSPCEKITKIVMPTKNIIKLHTENETPLIVILDGDYNLLKAEIDLEIFCNGEMDTEYAFVLDRQFPMR